MDNRAINLLVKELQKGKMDVFDEIYYETKDGVYFTIISILKNESIAEEIMQEVYFKMLHNIHSYDGRYFKAWITTIAKNMALNTYKKEKRTMIVDSQESDYLFTSKSNINEQYLVNDMKRILNNEEFDIVMMHIIGNMTHKNISKTIDKPLGTVLWIYNRAKKKLRDYLEVK